MGELVSKNEHARMLSTNALHDFSWTLSSFADDKNATKEGAQVILLSFRLMSLHASWNIRLPAQLLIT